MLILLIVILVGIGLAHGFSLSEYMKLGVNIIDFHYPFFHLGVSYQGYTMTNEEGERFELSTLSIGAVVINIFFTFYKQVSSSNLTTNDPTADPRGPFIFD